MFTCQLTRYSAKVLMPPHYVVAAIMRCFAQDEAPSLVDMPRFARARAMVERDVAAYGFAPLCFRMRAMPRFHALRRHAPPPLPYDCSSRRHTHAPR